MSISMSAPGRAQCANLKFKCDMCGFETMGSIVSCYCTVKQKYANLFVKEETIDAKEPGGAS